jgi:hypothetical protein
VGETAAWSVAVCLSFSRDLSGHELALPHSRLSEGEVRITVLNTRQGTRQRSKARPSGIAARTARKGIFGNTRVCPQGNNSGVVTARVIDRLAAAVPFEAQEPRAPTLRPPGSV